MNILSDFTLRVEDLLDNKIKDLLNNKKYAEKIEDIVTITQNKYTSIQVKKIINILGDELGIGLQKKSKKTIQSDKNNIEETAVVSKKQTKSKKN